MKRTRVRRGLSVPAALAAVLFLAPAAGLAQAREGSPELAALVPRVDAWTPSEAPRSFFPENLFEYIDGAAESYLSYEFRELLVVDLVKKGTEATLTLEIYDMGSPVNAFGIFGAERYPEAVAALGRASTLAPQVPAYEFNLAIACEEAGQLEDARGHWQRYLELEPTGQDSDEVRKWLLVLEKPNP